MMMKIETWRDERFLPSWVLNKWRNQTQGYVYADDLWLHLVRQMFFYASCLRFFHESQANDTSLEIGWVMLTDSDEFVRVNPYLESSSLIDTKAPGHVLRYMKELEQQQQGHPADRPCMRIPRLQIVSTEDLEQQQQQPSLRFSDNNTYNTSHFLTYRWLYHNGHEMSSPKNVVNVRDLTSEQIPNKVASVHCVLPDLCPPMDLTNTSITDPLREEESWLVIYHYLGTYEQFTYRDDPRDTKQNRREQWKTRGRKSNNTLFRTGDDALKLWLPGFVDSVGIDEAARLLENVGMLEEKPALEEVENLENDINEGNDRRNDDTVANDEVDKSFAACLLIKDDNHWLIEWLAYHYHVLPLRRIVVVRDPNSRTSPDGIFRRWRGRMNVTFCIDDDFLPPWVSNKYQEGSIDAARLHRYRQQFFYSHCLKALKTQSQSSWILLSDTDEFIKPNRRSSDGSTPEKEKELLLHPGAVLQALHDYEATFDVSSTNIEGFDCKQSDAKSTTPIADGHLGTTGQILDIYLAAVVNFPLFIRA